MYIIEKSLDKLNNFVLKNSVAIAILFPVIAVFLVFYIINNLQMNTDTRDMLSEDLQWRQLDIQYESLFPHVVDNLILVIEGQTADEAEDYARLLINELKDNKELFRSVYSFKEQDFFKKSSLLYLDLDELYDLSDNLASYQPFLAQLLADQSFGGFLKLLIKGLEQKTKDASIDIDPLLKEFNHTISAYNNNQHYQFSWQSLLSTQKADSNLFKEIIITQPELNYSELFPAENTIKSIKKIASDIGITEKNNLSLKMTGSVALAHEEFQSASKANLLAIIGALILVTILLVVGLGSYQLVLIALFCLITGLIYTASFATWAIGELNLISIAFAVLYIGLGVDFSIHYCLKFKSHFNDNATTQHSLKQTSNEISRPLFLCSITTAMGFFAFLITDYKGVAELGLIAGAGMFISLFITLTLLPALLKFIPISFQKYYSINRRKINWLDFPSKHAYSIIIISLVLSVISLMLLPKLSFDYDLLNIQPKDNESVITFKKLLADNDVSPLRNIVIVDSHQERNTIQNKLATLDSVKETLTLDSFIPSEQDEKLIIIDELNFLLGDLLNTGDKNKYGKKEITLLVSELITLLEKLNNLNLYKDTQENLSVLLESLNTLAKYESHVDSLEKKLFNSLQGRLDSLSDSLQAEELSLKKLPNEFKSRWLNQDQYLIEVIPENNLSDSNALKLFVSETQKAVKNITGPPVVSIEAGNAVIKAFTQAFTAAFFAVSFFLLFLIKHKTDVIFILIPLVLASLFTAAASVLFGIAINFANIIALPLLFGIGVDSAIHIVNQHKYVRSEKLLETSSAKAILISALTTMLSIGNLALSEHPGTASMGQLLVIGISIALVCTLAITPALLSIRTGKNN